MVEYQIEETQRGITIKEGRKKLMTVTIEEGSFTIIDHEGIPYQDPIEVQGSEPHQYADPENMDPTTEVENFDDLFRNLGYELFGRFFFSDMQTMLEYHDEQLDEK